MTVSRRIRRAIRYQRMRSTLLVDHDIACIQAELLNLGCDDDDVADLAEQSYVESTYPEGRLHFWDRQLRQMESVLPAG